LLSAIVCAHYIAIQIIPLVLIFLSDPVSC